MKFSIRKLHASEPKEGLGTNFGNWDTKFMHQIAIALFSSDFSWEGGYEKDCLSSRLEGKAQRHLEL